MSMSQRVDSRTRDLVDKSTRQILKASISPQDDIIAERSRATFDALQMCYALNGGKDKIQRRAQLVEALKRTSWGNKERRHFMTREEEYVEALRASFGIWEKMKQEKMSLEDGVTMRSLVDFPGGLELHIGMFIPSILSQGTPEQQQHWLPLCYDLSIIGTYAQTELGHGTFVRGLETTATYDKTTQEFVLHSPTLTSTKWWPGGLGKTATHAVVMARLFIDGKDYGPHAFVVQVRSLQDHLPLPGICVGDIGPKFGYGGVDNGYLAMDHLRISRESMLMRYSKVLPDGTYVPPPPSNAKASYATMVYVRADIVKNAGSVLAKAVTIATRYAAVRRQTAPSPGQPETQVLDYQNTSHTLLPLVAAAYAVHFMGETIMGMYKRFDKDRERGEFSSLPELHALSSGCKALCTWITADGIESCRRTCGGHGYSKLPGLPTLFQNYVQNVTWEGDNNVLCLQTARYLLKALVGVQRGQQATGSASYLNHAAAELHAKSAVQGASGWNAHALQSAMRHCATRLAASATAMLQSASRSAAGASSRAAGGLVFEGPAWNNSTVAMIKLTRAHCMAELHSNMLSSITALHSSGKVGGRELAVLQQLASLFALTHIEAHMGDYLEDGYFTGAQAASIRQRQNALLLELRPNAVALVDAFGIEDYVLNSALGRQDGDVYTALLDMAQGSPLNSSQEGPAWHTVLKPVMVKHSKM
uniref:Acyl-coenzyme A oxidase n=1 Tax=Dunaliella tertiolecta TaxID=3047 RepID=A0A2U8JGL6_DUNTE|nr:ACOX [Dunaliella tertiolecta]